MCNGKCDLIRLLVSNLPLPSEIEMHIRQIARDAAEKEGKQVRKEAAAMTIQLIDEQKHRCYEEERWTNTKGI